VHVACVYTDLSWWHIGRKFDVPVYTTRDIYIKAMRLLNLSGYPKRVRNLAVSVYDLIPNTDEQLELFASPSMRYQRVFAVEGNADRECDARDSNCVVLYCVPVSPEPADRGETLMKTVMLLLCCLTLTACAVGQAGYWRAPERADLNQQQDDHLECQALAAQSPGDWRLIHQPVGVDRDGAAALRNARDIRYAQCLQSRGYVWVPTP
jgi:hypothetical protein